jgi:hypothetical protein
MARFGLIIAALALVACASAPAASQAAESQSAPTASCFRSGEINGYNVIDRSHVRLTVGANRRYVLTTMWNTYDLDWTERIAIRSATGHICTGNGLGVELIGGTPRRRYPIVSIEAEPRTPAAQGS